MKKSNLINVFNSLSNKEIREFGLFARSPYFNRRQEVIDLFDYLVDYKDFPEDILAKERAWKHLFPNQTYEDNQMRYTMSFLLKTMKEFLIHQELHKDKTYTQVLLCRALRQRGGNRLFEKEIGAAIGWQEKQPYRNAHFHFNNYLLHMEREEAYPSQKVRTKDPLLQKSIDELTHFYISDILRQSCSVLSAQAMIQKNYTLNFLKEVLDHVEQTDYSDKPAIEIYFNGYKALSDLNADNYFNRLKSLIEKHWSDFPPGESRTIYLLAINCCIKRANRGNTKYKWECFELYKSGLQNKVLMENGALSQFTFTNASRLGLSLKQFDWVERFLKEYKQFLSTDEREHIYNFNMAFFYFQKPDYENAMQLLQKVDFKDVLNNLDSRRMLLRIYYELGYYDALDSLLDSFKTYLGRQKNIGYHKDNYANLIYFVKKILRTNLNDRSKKSQLIEAIEATQALAEKTWLLERLQ